MAAGCPSGGGENPPGKRFCAHCGARLSLSCPTCGAAVAADQRFCGDCGAPLSERAVGERPPLDARPPAGEPTAHPARVAERRVTSVLFGDLVSFTSLSELRDPEEVRELLSAYFDTARTVVTRYGGTVEKFIGDAVMAVWGVPTAHEDDAERAVRAGLDLVAAVSALGEQVNAPELDMRVGVVTGEVAVTLGAVGEGMVAGDAVNTAARVQAAAAAGTVLVDEATRQRTAAVAAADGALEAAEKDLASAAEELRAFGAKFYLGRALLERAGVLAGDADPGLSGALVDEARGLFVELQAQPWVEKTARVEPVSAA